MLTTLKRICKFACTDFTRNKGIGIAAIFVLVVTIMLVTGLLLFQGVTKFLISEVQNKIDITAYFKEETSEQNILKVKNEILKMSPEVKEVEYVSKEQALSIFQERHKENDIFSKAIEEVGGNPFLPSLNIKTSGDPSQYQEISNILQTEQFSQYIDSVDFSEKKDTIEKVFSITSNITRWGIVLGIILTLVAILVVFNTIKLAIDNSKDEINTMKIVGASEWFVRGPFIVQGALFGFIAFAICFVITGAFAYLISAKVAIILPGLNIFLYFLSNLWLFILIQIGFGAGLGMLSSFIVVRRYLKN